MSRRLPGTGKIRKLFPIRKNRCIQTQNPVLYYIVLHRGWTVSDCGRTPFFQTGASFCVRFFPGFCFRTARLPVLLYDSFLFLYFSAAGRVSPCGQINDGQFLTIRIRSIRVTQPNVCRRNGARQTAGVSSLRALFFPLTRLRFRACVRSLKSPAGDFSAAGQGLYIQGDCRRYILNRIGVL